MIRTPPRARPATQVPALVVALLLVALGVVAVHDLLVRTDVVTGASWSRSVLDVLDGARADALVVTLGIIAAVLGLGLVVVALQPARRTHQRVNGDVDLWVSVRAAAAVAREAADRTPGVVDAVAEARRRRIDVRVRARDDVDAVRERVEQSVRTQLDGLSDATVRVRAEQVPA